MERRWLGASRPTAPPLVTAKSTSLRACMLGGAQELSTSTECMQELHSTECMQELSTSTEHLRTHTPPRSTCPLTRQRSPIKR